MSNIGRFVWHELLTSDLKGAIAFYTEVVGWKTQPFEDSKEPYTMWVGSQGPLGGVMPLTAEAKKMGAVPQWMAHVEVADVEKTVEKAKSLGGKVHVPPQDIPKVGRFSVLADPQGATISVFKPAHPMAAHDVTKAGEFNWNELLTTDRDAALSFYSTLFGWEKTTDFDMGRELGKYQMYGQGGQTYGGMFNKSKDMPMPPMWWYYVHVDDLDGAVKRATSKGAKVMNGPMEVPGGDRICQLTDPQGVMFALHAAAQKK